MNQNYYGQETHFYTAKGTHCSLKVLANLSHPTVLSPKTTHDNLLIPVQCHTFINYPAVDFYEIGLDRGTSLTAYRNTNLIVVRSGSLIEVPAYELSLTDKLLSISIDSIGGSFKQMDKNFSPIPISFITMMKYGKEVTSFVTDTELAIMYNAGRGVLLRTNRV